MTVCANESPKADSGVIDLRYWDFENDGNIKLNGEWEFYWKRFLDPGDFSGNKNVDPVYIEIPGVWNNLRINDKEIKGTGYATFRLIALLPEKDINLSVKTMNIFSSCKIYINGGLKSSVGRTGITREDSEPYYYPHVINAGSVNEKMEIIIQVSNFFIKKGGMETILLGKERDILKERELRIGIDFFLFGGILIMAMYHLGLFIIRKKNYSPLYFSIFCFLLAIRIAVTGEHLIVYFPRVNWELMMKIEYLTFYLAAPSFVLFIQSLYPREFHKFVAWAIHIISGIFALVVIFTKAFVFSHFVQGFQVVTGLAGIYITYILILAMKRKRNGAYVLFTGWIILFLTIVNDILFYNELIHTGNLISLGLFIFIFFQAFLLSVRFSKAFFHAERLTKRLNYTNKNLSKIVEFRTAELQKQKEDLFYQKAEIEQIHKDITDSISYASRIQAAVLPTDQALDIFFPDHFILYKPKDIVSGDFYWTKRVRNKIMITAADCTGHGVPGAFMSLLGIAFLNEIVNFLSTRADDNEKIKPDLILTELRNRIKSSLGQTGDVNETQDGIDMAFCIIDYVENKLYYSGANNPLYVLNKKPKELNVDNDLIERKKIIVNEDNEHILYEIKADRMPIGYCITEQQFVIHELDLNEIDYIFMFSDGFTDQIGGPKNTKFRKKRFKQLLMDHAGQSMADQKAVYQKTIESWIGKEFGQIDDILVLGIQMKEESEQQAFGIF